MALAGLSALSSHAQLGGTIKVGILRSVSATMAISETVLKDTALMAAGRWQCQNVHVDQMRGLLAPSCHSSRRQASHTARSKAMAGSTKGANTLTSTT